MCNRMQSGVHRLSFGVGNNLSACIIRLISQTFPMAPSKKGELLQSTLVG
jgi:hypothetical protein